MDSMDDVDSELPDLSEPNPLSDVTLIVEGQPMYVSRYLLAFWSPVFAAMFRGDFTQNQTDGKKDKRKSGRKDSHVGMEKSAKEVALPGKKYSEMLDLLLFIHRPEVFQINDTNVRHMLRLGDEYEIKLMKKCEEAMMRDTRTKNALEYMWYAQEYGFSDLCWRTTEVCLKMNIEEVKQHEHFQLLSETNKVNLLSEFVHALEQKIQHAKGQRTYAEVNRVLDAKLCSELFRRKKPIGFT